MSFSGHERNHLFMNRSGSSFDDVSGVSGLNTDADSRSFAIVDFDLDGWQDIVLANVTAPVISFYRNQMGVQAANSENNWLLIDCIGGNVDPAPSTEFTARDAYGVKVSVSIDGQVLAREKRCGEGLAAQNSRFLHFGLGKQKTAKAIKVTWPSGAVQEIENVPAGKLVRVFESAKQSASGNGFDVVDAPKNQKTGGEVTQNKAAKFETGAGDTAKFKMYVSMATWCDNCKKHIPHFRFLSEQYTSEQLAIVGIPVDETDTPEKLQTFTTENNPSYEIAEIPFRLRRSFRELIMRETGSNVLPSTVIADEAGNVLDVFRGVATVSQLSKLGVLTKQSDE